MTCNKRLLEKGLFVLINLFITSGALFANGKYSRGQGRLLWNSDASVFEVPATINELVRRIDTQMSSGGLDGGLLNVYETAGTAVLLMLSDDDWQELNFTVPAGWTAVDLDGDGAADDGIAKGFGYADISNTSGGPLDPLTTVFQVCSMSKPVSAYGAYQMKLRGWLNLTDSVNSHIASVWKIEQANLFQTWNTNDVTINKLIHHQSGLDQSILTGGGNNYGWYPVDLTATYPYDRVKSSSSSTTERVIPNTIQNLNGDDNIDFWMGKVKLYGNPNSKDYFYSPAGYSVLQLVMETILSKKDMYSGAKFYEAFPFYMRDNVLNPLQMNNSSFLYSRNLNNAKCYRYVKWEKKPGNSLLSPALTESLEYTHLLFPISAAANLHTTVVDYGKFLLKIMDEGVVSTVLHDSPVRNLVWWNPSYFFENQWYIVYENGALKDVCPKSNISSKYTSSVYSFKLLPGIYNHQGALDGWNSSFYILPKKSADSATSDAKSGIVILTNSGTCMRQAGSMIYFGGAGVHQEITDAWKALYISRYGENPASK
jgi:CubicO group peptidase (beta-lactamase class C family)